MADIAIENIRKSYPGSESPAVDGINLLVEKGELFGLIGPDGAGKTSLFRMLTTLLLPDSGKASVTGYDIVKDYKKIRKTVGYMPGKFSLYPDLSVEENLNFFATVFGTTITENRDLINDIYIQIEPFKNRRAGKLSGGMKQKLALCCALIHRPSVLFLDEPTTGVDAVSRKEFWKMLGDLKRQGITIFVSTPYMDEATLCERIALIQNGKILSVDSPTGIIENFASPLWALKADNMGPVLKDLRTLDFIKSCQPFGDYHHLVFAEDNSTLENKTIEYLASKGHQNLEIKLIEPSIEDCFIQLMDEPNG